MATSISPRESTEIYESLRSKLTGKIEQLTNFSENSFNFVWTNAFAEQQHQQEVAALAVQLSGWVEYAGKNITEDDLDELGVTGTTPEEVNQYIDDQQLDQLGALVGAVRDQGSRATGQVQVTTNRSMTIEEGTSFGTQTDSSGNFLEFETTESVTTDAAETVTVDVQAVEIGEEYNVGANSITYIPNPPTGVANVNNSSGTVGGTNVQDNESFREDVQRAVLESSEGGTEDSIEAFIENQTEAIDVIVRQKFTGDTEHGSYPHADVVALGGTDTAVNDAIQKSHPSGVEHILVRPKQFGVNVTVDVEGTNVDTARVENDIAEYFNELLLGDNVVRDKLIQIIMNADPDIQNISTLQVEINNEILTYNSQSTNHPYYILDKGSSMEQSVGITSVSATVSGSDTVLTEGSDYEEYDSTNNNYTSPNLDAVNFDVNGDGTTDGVNPDEDTNVEVTYRIAEDIPITDEEVANSGNVTVSVV